MKLETKRMKFFKINVNADKVLYVYTCDFYTEITVKRGGDIECYRVYGKDKADFSLTMK